MIEAPILTNAVPIPLDEVPTLEVTAFRAGLLDLLAGEGRLAALFGMPEGEDHVRLYGVAAQPDQGTLSVLATTVGDEYPALTPEAPQAHWFEREIAEQWGVVPAGHPWLKPIRFHPSYRPGKDAWGRIQDGKSEPILPSVLEGKSTFFRVEGLEVHEVAVGPIHAGVIEPGHFRFQCRGEEVFHLEISLGFQHRGVERRLVGGPDVRTIPYMETLAGDTTVGHTTAYCQVIEGLAGASVPPRAQVLRGIALELERLANHVGDLGALAGDVGYLPTAAYCGRLRGDFLNTTAQWGGNRFGRSLIRPGGVGIDAEPERLDQMRRRVAPALEEVAGAVELLWHSSSVRARFENVGRITPAACRDLGIVGLAARACGIDQDVRPDYPTGVWRFSHIPTSVFHTGDVFARAFVRALEIRRSGDFLLAQLPKVPAGPTRNPVGPLRPDSLIVSLVEGWRGPMCHVALTDGAGRFAHYKVVDPSFHNWIGLAMALRNQQISDFPLCNKSFNLSYCGHDL
jgi:Ni,Fe-hydrogenase III large subunit